MPLAEFVRMANGLITAGRYSTSICNSSTQNLLRSMFGPPPGLDLSLPWHEILHSWTVRAREFTERFRMLGWAETCLRQRGQLAHHVNRLPLNAWVRRTLDELGSQSIQHHPTKCNRAAGPPSLSLGHAQN